MVDQLDAPTGTSPSSSTRPPAARQQLDVLVRLVDIMLAALLDTRPVVDGATARGRVPWVPLPPGP
ncbi:hypothetical protein [Dactylosporangium sp. NPDC050588]|uniref:hypothetical protein n=1 Tax=Dactylosporangium sp. NPDC050588 TaxID=3157211 RepID=UPI0033F59CA8